MQQIKILFFLLIAASFSYASDPLAPCYQLLVVTTNSWEGVEGELQCYEKRYEDSAWQPVGEPKPVVVGSAGLAWGIGLHPKMDKSGPE
ncbi:MAG TPA: hypothetical protein DCE71_01150 [Parachlamydiales bacterium]|nr:hypothetical protein [Parachlamydiales bacterium]